MRAWLSSFTSTELQTIAAIVQAVAAAIQTAAAAFLLWLTWRTVALTRQMAAASDAQLRRLDRAELIGQIEPRGIVVADYVLTSLGPAPARNVRLRLALGSDVSEWQYPLLQAGRSERFRMPGGLRTFDDLEKEPSGLHVDLRYDDGSGEPQQHVETIPCAQLIAVWKAAGWLQIRSEAEELRYTIRDELRRATERISIPINAVADTVATLSAPPEPKRTADENPEAQP